MKPKLELAGAVIAALILLQTLFFKFTGAEESRWIFSQLGAEPYGRIGSGVIELIVAVALLIPLTRGVAALVAMGVMAGALATHIFVIGIEVKGDGGLLFGLALLVFVIAGLISIRQRQNILSILKQRGVLS